MIAACCKYKACLVLTLIFSVIWFELNSSRLEKNVCILIYAEDLSTYHRALKSLKMGTLSPVFTVPSEIPTLEQKKYCSWQVHSFLQTIPQSNVSFIDVKINTCFTLYPNLDPPLSFCTTSKNHEALRCQAGLICKRDWLLPTLLSTRPHLVWPHHTRGSSGSGGGAVIH